MKILVCIRQGRNGEINPFDACAYEEALKISGAEITIISMGPPSAKDFLLGLTRLGAKKAILLTDRAFAGADTLATAYTLSLAVNKLNPDLIFCGRQTLEGDTAQVGPMLSVMADRSLITNVMGIISTDGNKIICETRDQGVISADFPALITVERINNLRLPSIRSKIGEIEVLSADDIGADISRCGLTGSPTRVLKTYENESGKRKCNFITADKLNKVIAAALEKSKNTVNVVQDRGKLLEKVFIVGNAPMEFAKSISDDITVVANITYHEIAERIKAENPSAVLWGSDAKSKADAARVAAILNLGLCADCTALETDGQKLFMYRPALSGSIIAKIESLTRPAMATVRTTEENFDNIIVTAGFGVKDNIEAVKKFADNLGAAFGATRKAVDNGILPYENQIGLTGKTVSPPVYIAIGVSGAVHHIVGMQRSGTVIAINPDKSAPIFDYADYGITENFENIIL